MAQDSKAYYSQYNLYKKQAMEYGKNIEALTKIKDNLVNNMYDEQGDVNKELNDLREDLHKSVRHDPTFSVIASEAASHKEKSVAADAHLNHAVSALENEIASLNSKKITAEQNRDAQYQSYKTAKEQERQEWLDSLKNLMTGG